MEKSNVFNFKKARVCNSFAYSLGTLTNVVGHKISNKDFVFSLRILRETRKVVLEVCPKVSPFYDTIDMSRYLNRVRLDSYELDTKS